MKFFEKKLLTILLILIAPTLKVWGQVSDQSDLEKTQSVLLAAESKDEAIEVENNKFLQRHNPLYFIFGNPATKVQLSFKTPILNDMPLYLGFTQNMFWNIWEDSSPFLDSTFNPEIFYTFKINKDILKNIHLGFWEHNSNGKAEVVSRAYDRFYIKADFVMEKSRSIYKLSPKISYVFRAEQNNSDIREYISPFELKASWIQLYSGFIDKSELSFRFIPGGRYAHRLEKGGYEVGLSFRLGKFKLVPAFYLQYFEGYAENLLNYDKKAQQFRAGFIF